MKATVRNQAMLDNERNLLRLIGAKIDADGVTFENNDNIFIILDTETTGLDKEKDRIVQFSGIKYRCVNGVLEEIGRMDQYINQPLYDENKIIPGKNGNPDKTFKDLTGITNEMLSKAPSEEEAFKKIKNFIGKDPIFICYNTPFDYGMLVELYLRYGDTLFVDSDKKLDVLVMVKDLVSKEDAPVLLDDNGNVVNDSKGKPKKTYKLSFIAGLYGLDKAEDSDDTIAFHSSINDVVVTGRLLNVLILEYLERKVAELKKPEVKKSRAIVKSVSYYPGFRGYSKYYVNAILDGEYVSYSFDLRKKIWSEKVEGTIEKTDFDLLKKDAFELCGVSDEVAFSKMGEIEKIYADDDFLARYNT
jgi:DNA polymerase III epsilon subunit-like protein